MSKDLLESIYNLDKEVSKIDTAELSISELSKLKGHIGEMINVLKSKENEIDDAVLNMISLEEDSLYDRSNGAGSYGQRTVNLDGHKVTIHRRKYVKYDNDQMIRSGKNLSWDELNIFYKIKFGMSETGYDKLKAAAIDNPKFSDVLSMVDEAREVQIKETQLKNIEPEG